MKNTCFKHYQHVESIDDAETEFIVICMFSGYWAKTTKKLCEHCLSYVPNEDLRARTRAG